VALQHAVKNFQLPQPIAELRILYRAARDRGIKAPKDLLERIVVTFAVPAGKIGEAARRRL